MQARFEALLSQGLTTDQEARVHRAAKALREASLSRALGAKAAFERNRERQRKRAPTQ
jgi:hypothetical protein